MTNRIVFIIHCFLTIKENPSYFNRTKSSPLARLLSLSKVQSHPPCLTWLWVATEALLALLFPGHAIYILNHVPLLMFTLLEGNTVFVQLSKPDLRSHSILYYCNNSQLVLKSLPFKSNLYISSSEDCPKHNCLHFLLPNSSRALL